jgi:DNA-binding beta-propeller fold protein YncE
MRYLGRGFCFLAALLALAGPAGAADPEGKDVNPSLEYRPPRPVLPEPRQMTPAPPVLVFKETLGGFGIGTGSFDRPVDLTGDRNGNVFVLDAGNSRVQMFDKSGIHLLQWGSFGAREGDFQEPNAIAFDPDGYLHVVDSGNHRVQTFEILYDSGQKCSGGDSKLLAQASGGMRGNYPKICLYAAWGSLGSRSGDFKSPLDITFDDDANIFVLDAGNERVQLFPRVRSWRAGKPDMTGEFGTRFGSRGGTFTDLVSIAWSDDRGGYLYLLGGPGCTVQRFETNGSLLETWSAAAPQSGACVPERIEIDNKHEMVTNIVYILDSGNNLLMRFTEEGRYLTGIHGAASAFAKPRGISIQEDRGEIAVADTGNNIVQKFTIR